ncbi:peptide/nickel transport system permease protein [Candidatus Nanopelagicus hibericus]|uniref:Peptide/nickel transport system permease protein n=1 Tax=Candidatus Nanopelagicus hibericus TaxID=1884915 RepID=A0A249K8H5_9ACTN|nr:ABC transporter permease [Candidatus Nanopelagicus hibericus]ASY13029.1 peptide/nickel transport system permease protein [Candidatus Nanopelagicus hibericus]
MVSKLKSANASAAGQITSRSPRQIAWRRFRRNKVGMVSAGISIVVLMLSLFAPVVCKILGINPDELNLDLIDSSGIPTLPNGGISWEHPLGLTPGIGRDLLANLLYGSRISFLVAFLTTGLAIFIGLIVGIVGGYFRGRIDDYLGRFTDFLLAFPAFFMIVALSEPMVARIQETGIAQGNGARVIFLIFFLSFFGWPGFSRLVRSQVLSLRERDFVTAAQAMGASRKRIIFKELMPNLWAPVIVVVSLSLPGYLAAEAVFSFLGIGIQPPATTWGILLDNARRFVTVYPNFFLITAGSLVLVVLAFNLVGDALRDALDPRSER